MRKKQCTKCAAQGVGAKPLRQFRRRAKSPDGLDTRCKEHRSLDDKAWAIRNRTVLLARKRAYYHANRNRISAWMREYRRRNGEAINAVSREKRALNPLRYKAYDLKKNYGLSLDEFHTMLAQQCGKCAVCLRDCALNVDHCHTSGVVRGLLCSGCNVALGRMQDDPARLRRAADYLERK